VSSSEQGVLVFDTLLLPLLPLDAVVPGVEVDVFFVGEHPRLLPLPFDLTGLFCVGGFILVIVAVLVRVAVLGAAVWGCLTFTDV
jgi:hypothetical protein